MNQDFDWDGNPANGGGDGYQTQLSKEQLEYLEATFMQFMSKEMRENNSNCEEFFELLNQACQAEKARSSSFPPEEKREDARHQDGTQHYSTGYPGFKINTEATRKQYSSCNTSRSNPFEQNNVNEKKDNKSSFDGCYSKTDEKELPKSKYKSKTDNNKNSSSTSSKSSSNIRKDYENSKGETQSKTSNTTRTANKLNKNKNNCADGPTNNMDEKHPAVDGIMNTFDSLKPYYLEFSVTLMNMMTFISTKLKWGWGKTKAIILFFLCMLLIVVVALWRILWFVVCIVFKVTLFLILWVMCKVLNVVYVTNLKYDVFTKMRSYISSGVDLLFYITGINLKTIFSRKKTDTPEAYDESIILPLPTTPEEAVRHLLFQTEDKPFRALCANRDSTNDEVKVNYRKMALLVHPDKCVDPQADEAFKVLDSCFKTLTDPEKRSKLMEEDKRRKEWEEFTKRYSGFEDDFETMMNDLINSISCSKCFGKHKRTLVKDRTFYDARYCGDCHMRHSANDGDIWAESNMFGLNWTCYVCMDGEVYELTEWAECQNLRQTIPINCHRVVCRLGNQKAPAGAASGNRRRNKQESAESKKSRRKRNKKGGRKS